MPDMQEEVQDGQQDKRIVSRMLAEAEGPLPRDQWARAYVAGRRDMYLAACIFLGTHGFRPTSQEWLQAWDECGSRGLGVTPNCNWPRPCASECERCQELDERLARNFAREDS